MAELDNVLFRLPGLIDYTMNEAGELFALSDGTLSEEDIRSRAAVSAVTVRRVQDSDKALYLGKRKILPV